MSVNCFGKEITGFTAVAIFQKRTIPKCAKAQCCVFHKQQDECVWSDSLWLVNNAHNRNTLYSGRTFAEKLIRQRSPINIVRNIP